jgi:hypothetical protein
MLKVPGLSIVQVNTDGVTVRVPRSQVAAVDEACAWWMQATGLNLERAVYKRMWIANVNNYLAEYDE